MLEVAGYKVNITVFKDAKGKTMKGLSFLHFLGDICQALGLMTILGGIACMMDRKLSPLQIGIFVVFTVAGFVGGAMIHKIARKKGQARYLESLVEMENSQEGTKTS